MTFHRIAREDRPCFGCSLPMNHCVCDHEVCSKCKWTLDDYGFCACRGTGLPSMAEVQAQIAEAFAPTGWALAEQSAIQPRKAA